MKISLDNCFISIYNARMQQRIEISLIGITDKIWVSNPVKFTDDGQVLCPDPQPDKLSEFYTALRQVAEKHNVKILDIRVGAYESDS